MVPWDQMKWQSWRLARRILPPPARNLLRRTLPSTWLPQGAYARAYHRRLGLPEGTPLTPLQKMYVDFALLTNERGEWSAQIIQRFKDIQGSRCLDIGCAYCGFLVGLGKFEARELVGIDVDEHLLKLGRINLEEHGFAAQLKRLDMLDSAAMEKLGKFDVVVSNDVLEHVAALPLAIENTCRTVAKDGILYAVVPNKYFVRYLLKDGHYQLPGITLLSHADAEAYYNATRTGSGYSVGHYRTFDYYRHHLRKSGMSVELFRSGLGVYDLQLLKDEFQGVGKFFETFSEPSVPPHIVHKIAHRARIVCSTFGNTLDQYERACSKNSEEASRLGDEIITRYGMEAWYFIARKAQGWAAAPPGRWEVQI